MPSPAFHLPLVSVVVTNYNYARFLRDAVATVDAQSYPRIELVIVDDASTDDSAAVLDDIAQRAPSAKIIRLAENGGQTNAFRIGFAASAGEYVVFLDADDLLLPAFVETHIFTHLSLRAPVGFTTSDMLQAYGTNIVVSGWMNLSAFAISGRGALAGGLRRIDAAAPELWDFQSALPADIESRIHLLPADDWTAWVYAPTSGNCFRRDALTLFLPHVGAAPDMRLRVHADSYVNKAVCLMSGAALIDLPLTVYRIHGGNGLTGFAELSGLEAADREKSFRAEYNAWRAVADRLVDAAETFIPRMSSQRYARALATLQRASVSSPEFPDYESLTTYIETRLAERAGDLKTALGDEKYALLVAGVVAARGGQPRRKRLAPRPWMRPIAEFFLTFGRLLHLRGMRDLGERLWHF